MIAIEWNSIMSGPWNSDQNCTTQNSASCWDRGAGVWGVGSLGLSVKVVEGLMGDGVGLTFSRATHRNSNNPQAAQPDL